LLKNILAYCGYSLTSPFFLLLSEHKHCDNAATNSNSENARSRMAASLRGSVGMGTREDESSTGCIWAAGFHHVTAHFTMLLPISPRYCPFHHVTAHFTILLPISPCYCPFHHVTAHSPLAHILKLINCLFF